VNTQCPCDAQAEEKWPNVVACLVPQWREGKCHRQAGRLTIKPLGCVWEVTLSCPAEGVDTSVRVASLIDGLDALESLLRSGEAIWQPDWATQKKIRQTKKA
jgi:hypothetical protein